MQSNAFLPRKDLMHCTHTMHCITAVRPLNALHQSNALLGLNQHVHYTGNNATMHRLLHYYQALLHPPCTMNFINSINTLPS